MFTNIILIWLDTLYKWFVVAYFLIILSIDILSLIYKRCSRNKQLYYLASRDYYLFLGGAVLPGLILGNQLHLTHATATYKLH